MRKRGFGKKRRRLISVSPFTVLCAAALIALGYGVTLLSYAVVLLLHEFAHAFVAERLGYTLKSVRVMPYGISIDGNFEDLRGGHEAAIAIAGPAVNLLCWIVLTGVWWQFPETYVATQFLAEASFFTAAVNLIPVYPLDGGRVMRGLLSLRLSPEKTARITGIVGWTIGIGVSALCLAGVILGSNYTYATLAIFILSSLVLPGKGGKYESIYSMANSEKRLKRGLRVRELMIDGGTSLLAMYKMLRPDYYTKFVLTDASLRELKTVTETELTAYLANFSPSEKAISVALTEKK